MKKTILFLGIMLLGFVAFSQQPVTTYKYATMTTPLGRTLVDGNFIFVESNGMVIEVKKTFTASYTPTTILANKTCKAYIGGMYTTANDTINFLTTATRRAKYVAGVLSTDHYIVSMYAKATGVQAKPVAGDLANIYAVNDSIVVMRAAGTTSNTIYQFIRIK